MTRNPILPIIMLIMIIAANLFSGCSNTEDKPPVPGNHGRIEFPNIEPNSITLKWEKATDDNTNQNYLDYMAVVSQRDNVATLSQAESKGRKIPIFIETDEELDPFEEPTAYYWHTDLTSIEATDLEDGQVYYFNVVARDKNWQRAAYRMASAKTIDITPPVPGNAGLITISDETVIEDNDNLTVTLQLNWERASDNNSDGADVLQYRVVRSTESNIANILDAEENDETPGDPVWEKDEAFQGTYSRIITGLPYGTNHYFNILVRDETLNTAAYSMISQAPTAGNNGRLTITDEGASTLVLNWDKATDSENDISGIQYRVVFCTTEIEDIDTIEEAEENDETPIGEQGYHPDINSLRIQNLTGNTSYYFNVIARDIAGIKTIYIPLTNKPIPGGNISIINKGEHSITLTWPPASDNGFTPSGLQYRVYRKQSSERIYTEITPEEVEATYELLSPAWQSDITTFDITDLDTEKDYLFSVIVRDSADNKAAYQPAVLTGTGETEALALTNSDTIPEDLQSSSHTGNTEATPQTAGQMIKLAKNPETTAPDSLNANEMHLIAWLDASTFPKTILTAYTSPFAVTIWPDISGTNNHGLQPIPELQPWFVNDGIPVIYFARNIAQHFEIPLATDLEMIQPGDAYTIFMVLQNQPENTAGLTKGCYFEGGDGTDKCGLYYQQTDGGAYTLSVVADGAPHLPENLTLPPDAMVVIGVEFVKNQAGMVENTLYIDGRRTTLSEPFRHPTTIKQFNIGAPLALPGSTPDPDTCFNGFLGEWILFDRTLSQTELDAMQTYLTGKWTANP